MNAIPTSNMRHIFIAGGTGYIGSRLIPALLASGHHVRALVRPGSEHKLPPGCQAVLGNALEKTTFDTHVNGADTFINLIGVSHPNPLKAEQFRQIDLASVYAALESAQQAGIEHFLYVSVAQPAPVMKAFIKVRAECEALIRASGLNATILRPWYVLGPGHWWPYVLVPFYWTFEKLPFTQDTAKRLGLVKLNQIVKALQYAVGQPAAGVRIIDVEQIKNSSY